MFREVEGNLFTIDVHAIGHGCNCEGIMGAGVALSMRLMYPEMFEEYQGMCREGLAKPGAFWEYAAEDGKTIYNLFTQPTAGPSARLMYIRDSVLKALIHWRSWRTLTSGTDFAVPQLGSGLGGLEWPDVRGVLKEVAERVPEVDLIAVTYKA